MPNIKSAKKRVKVIATKTLNNKMFNSALKTEIKKADAAIENNADNKAEAVRVAVKKIDQAAAKGILHKNNAARKESRSHAQAQRFRISPCILIFQKESRLTGLLFVCPDKWKLHKNRIDFSAFLGYHRAKRQTLIRRCFHCMKSNKLAMVLGVVSLSPPLLPL